MTSTLTRPRSPKAAPENVPSGSWLYRLGYVTASHPWKTIGVWVLVAATLLATIAAFGARFTDSMSVPGLDSDQAMALLEESGAAEGGMTAHIVVHPLAGDAPTPTVDELAELVAGRAAALPNVVATDIQRAPGGDTADALILIQYRPLPDLSPADLDELTELVDAARSELAPNVQVEAGGELFWTFEEADSGVGEIGGVIVAGLILLVAFGSLIAMGLPLVLALAGLGTGMGIVAVATHIVTVPSFAPQMATMIGLGVGIDYALFIVTRFRELSASPSTRAETAVTVGQTVATSGRAVLFAGGTVVVAILGLAVAGVPFMTALGFATVLVVAATVAASITLLPAVLGLVGPHIDRWSLHRRSTSDRMSRSGVPSERWRRWGEHVARHSVAYTAGAVALTMALALPTLSLRLGFPDEGTLAETRTERRAYDLIADGFGPGTNGPMLIAVDLGTTDAAAANALLGELARQIEADDGVVAVTEPVVNLDRGVATMAAIPSTAPQDEATYTTIQRLRAEAIPAALRGGPPGAAAHIGGQTAMWDDIAAKVSDRLPWFIAAVIGVSFVLLMMVFRSILVPIKAAVLNLLSIGAAYGVLVMVFQWGWAKELFGLETTVPIISFIPMFMFALLFGLSMDYEVFLLSRVREYYLRTGDNQSSVIAGIASTARVITSAALIMIAVFGGFVFSSDPTVKMLGLGMATAILIDATIIRLVLVPASMTLMGDANWWLPKRLVRR